MTKLVEDMFESMYAAKGVGLAAPQVHESVRVFAALLGDDPDAVLGLPPAERYARFFEHFVAELR